MQYPVLRECIRIGLVIFRKTTKTSDRIQTCFQSKNDNPNIIRKWQNEMNKDTPLISD